MKTLLIMGYGAFDLGIFDEKDVKLTVIKKAIRKQLERFASDGLEWLILGGNLGFEYWVLQVALDMKADYGFQLASILPFKTHGQNWNEANQEKLGLFKTVDFVQYAYDAYENPGQFRIYNDFLISNANGAYIFYDEENETKLKYAVESFKQTENFPVTFLRFDDLQEIADEMNEDEF
ncbi:DUF1273 domain-containing protein [Pseudolactococcus insecticola]|uniref:UPF0398 protein Hs20B_00140 n=1 Tax=Pseudolactococcus insecticola TaxID=2709158 RepID=A0A6A0B3G0_9LACT|nr:DUF1273 domain-containing protein [Lactococcus insecticola]GFH39616.1 UPF0398 protein YfdB [Lactococcus insecticola]